MHTIAQPVERVMDTSISEATADVVDFVLHDIFRIRLINPAPRDREAMAALLGHPVAKSVSAVDNRPTIVIHFVDALQPDGLVYLGLNATAFTGTKFYLLDPNSGKVRAQIPFDTIGEHCEIVCRRGRGDIPLIDDIIRFTLLKQGYLPLHASAVQLNGRGILIVGWTKGGKTETLLALAKIGAHYVGDEVIYLTPDGEKMFGLPVPVTLWSWHLPYVREIVPPLSRRKRLFFSAAHILNVFHRLLPKRQAQNRFSMRLLTKFVTLVNQQRKLVLSPHALFGGRMQTAPVKVDSVILAMSHAADVTRLLPVCPEEVAARMCHSNANEENYFMRHYQAFRFALPDRRNELLENAAGHEQRLLHTGLVNKSCFKLVHPYPVSLNELARVLKPLYTES